MIMNQIHDTVNKWMSLLIMLEKGYFSGYVC